MKTFSYSWQYLAQFFLEWATFYAEVVEKMKTLILRQKTFFLESCHYELMSKNMVEPEEPQMTSQYGVSSCMLEKQGYMPTRPSTRTHHTHKYVILIIAFPGQQWLRESAPVLSYTYIASLVLLCRQ